LVRIGPTAWPFTGFIQTDRQLDKYILDKYIYMHIYIHICLIFSWPVIPRQLIVNINEPTILFLIKVNADEICKTHTATPKSVRFA
jgi:hypothetical protein